MILFHCIIGITVPRRDANSASARLWTKLWSPARYAAALCPENWITGKYAKSPVCVPMARPMPVPFSMGLAAGSPKPWGINESLPIRLSPKTALPCGQATLSARALRVEKNGQAFVTGGKRFQPK